MDGLEPTLAFNTLTLTKQKNKRKMTMEYYLIAVCIVGFTIGVISQKYLKHKKKPILSFGSSRLDKVKEFHEAFKLPISEIDDTESHDLRRLRIRFIIEELSELCEAEHTKAEFCFSATKKMKAWGVITENKAKSVNSMEKNMRIKRKKQLNAILDLEYVLLGKVLTAGFKDCFDHNFNLMHERNMNLVFIDNDNPSITKRKDGKILKSVNYKSVEINLYPNIKKT